jgi:Trk K+ transport system NAD-binding subunit/NhaP-type Na+/H+ or K+/H+ antiporter
VAASGSIAKTFLKFKLPLITGFLAVGIIAGPYVANLITKDAVHNLIFINDISLAFIAFAAGAELYLKELRGQFKTISWMTFGQLVVTFVLSTIILYYIAAYMPFMKTMSSSSKIAVSMLIATIFVACSPASAIAIINELRAKGKFTQTAIGVTVIKDVLVIILFTICFALAGTLINNETFHFTTILILLAELVVSIAMGIVFGNIIKIILLFNLHKNIKTVLIVGLGWGIYAFADITAELSLQYLNHKIYLEPLLISIVASFYTINYTKHRIEFLKIIEDAGPVIYIMFFTLTGAAISLDVLANYWMIALVLFFIRLATMMLGSVVGAWGAKETPKFMKLGWMPFVTQAGVGLGLVTVVAVAYPQWGNEFETILIAVIVLNQVVGPPLFKFAITQMGESHVKAKIPEFDGIREALIFGFENQSVALAKTLNSHGWVVKIATFLDDINNDDYPHCEIIRINDYSRETFEKLKASHAEAIIAMQTDEENFKICEFVYENCGTRAMVVRLNDLKNAEKFNELGALIVEPSMSIVNLLYHFAQSPVATSILLGMEEHKETIDIEVVNPAIKGLALRDLRLPSDILILSVKRKGSTVISHGYTRLRIGDVITVVGSEESIDKVKLKFE